MKVCVNLKTGTVAAIGDDVQQVPGTLVLHVDRQVRPGDDVLEVKEFIDSLKAERENVERMRRETLQKIKDERRDFEKRKKGWINRLEAWQVRLLRREAGNG